MATKTYNIFETIDVLKNAAKGIEDKPVKKTAEKSEADLLTISIGRYLQKKNKSNVPILALNEETYKVAAHGLQHILEASEPNCKKWNMMNNPLENRLLLAWFCKDKEKFDATAKDMDREDLSINKNLYIHGEKGTGKSSTVSSLNELIQQFPKDSKKESRYFKFVEQNKMNNTFEIESNINKYTFNEEKGKFEGDPHNIVLDDLKLDPSKLTKSFGTDFKNIISRFLYDRYSIWLFGQADTIITSLLSPKELETHIDADLYQRFQHQYNCITFIKSERKA